MVPPFKLKSGNTPLFKHMGSSPLQAAGCGPCPPNCDCPSFKVSKKPIDIKLPTVNLPKVTFHGKHHKETGQSRTGKVIRTITSKIGDIFRPKGEGVRSYKNPRFL